MPTSTQRNTPYPTDYGFVMFAYYVGDGNWNANDHVGDVTMEWYIHLHQRKYL